MKRVTYGFRHFIILLLGSAVGWVSMVKFTSWILPSYPFGFVHEMMWGFVFFIFFFVIMMRMNSEMKITIGILLSTLIACIVIPYLIFYTLSFL